MRTKVHREKVFRRSVPPDLPSCLLSTAVLKMVLYISVVSTALLYLVAVTRLHYI